MIVILEVYEKNLLVYPCFCIHKLFADTKDWITHILFVHKYIYARIEINPQGECDKKCYVFA